MKLTAAILHYNNMELTKGCVDSLVTQVFPQETECIIVDNGSKIPLEERDIKSSSSHPWRIVRLPQNTGNIGGQNACFHAAQGEWILFLANDVRLSSGFSESLNGLFRKGTEWVSKLGQAQPILLTPSGKIDQAGMNWWWPGYGIGIRRIWGINYLPEIVPSTCYLMRKAVWEKLGGFDESLGSSHEDVDFGIRLKQAGYLNVLMPVFAVHLVNQTLKHTIKNPRQTFQEARLKVIRKHYKGMNRIIRVAAIKGIYHLQNLFTLA